MQECRLCNSTTELDDIAVGSPTGRYVCLRCFQHHTFSSRPVPTDLREEIEDTLEQLKEEPA
jgi:hypothetical protein